MLWRLGNNRQTAGVIVALLALYVLSIGPVAVLVESRQTPPGLVHALEIVYLPLIWLVDQPEVEKPLRAYVEAWRSAFPSARPSPSSSLPASAPHG
jgi:hypothetical protein